MMSVLPRWDTTPQSLSGSARTTCCQINLLKRSGHDSLVMGGPTNVFRGGARNVKSSMCTQVKSV